MQTEIDPALIEQILEGECKCESKHTAEGNEVCSGEVTHFSVAECRSARALLCANAAASVLVRMSRFYHVCVGCGRPVAECWEVRPV